MRVLRMASTKFDNFAHHHQDLSQIRHRLKILGIELNEIFLGADRIFMTRADKVEKFSRGDSSDISFVERKKDSTVSWKLNIKNPLIVKDLLLLDIKVERNDAIICSTNMKLKLNNEKIKNNPVLQAIQEEAGRILAARGREDAQFTAKATPPARRTTELAFL